MKIVKTERQDSTINNDPQKPIREQTEKAYNRRKRRNGALFVLRHSSPTWFLTTIIDFSRHIVVLSCVPSVSFGRSGVCVRVGCRRPFVQQSWRIPSFRPCPLWTGRVTKQTIQNVTEHWRTYPYFTWTNLRVCRNYLMIVVNNLSFVRSFATLNVLDNE